MVGNDDIIERTRIFGFVFGEFGVHGFHLAINVQPTFGSLTKKVQSIQLEGGIYMDADTSNNSWHQ